MSYQVAIQQQLADFIKEAGIGYSETTRSYVLDCPKCGKKKLYMDKKQGFFICFFCATRESFHGRCEYALSEITGQPIGDIKEKLYGKKQYQDIFNVVFSYSPFEEEEQETNTIRSYFEKIYPPWYYNWEHPNFKEGLEYFESRGVPLSVIQKYDLRYSKIDKRVIFPIKVDNQLIGWQGRYILPVEIYDEHGTLIKKLPKILTSANLQNDVFMFQDNAKDSEHIFLAEGPFDALKGDLVGGNIASMGKNLNKPKIQWLIEHPAKTIYLALDPDAAQETTQIIKALSGQSNKKIYTVDPYPGREDMGECSFEEVLYQKEHATLADTTRIFVYFKRN